MQNNRNYGFNQYQQVPTSSGSDWSRETEWSTPDESWRGAATAQPMPYDSWKQRNPDPPRNEQNERNFQYGRDRAPSTVDDQFLVKFGAKRLNNGNLVDRDGYTLRMRDPECSAPSPPPFNPRKQFKKEKTPELGEMSQDDLDRKVKQQLEMMEKMKQEEERREKMRIEKEIEEVGGVDEYEDVEEPPPKQPTPAIVPEHPKNSIKPRREDNWYDTYKKHVDELKEQVYKIPPQPKPGLLPTPPSYFFPSVPPTSSYHSPGPSSSMIPPVPTHQKPPQMDLPPPGLIHEDMFQPNRRELPAYQPPRNLGNIDAFGVRIGSRPPVIEDSSDSEEDEAMTKLREIINTFGNHHS